MNENNIFAGFGIMANGPAPDAFILQDMANNYGIPPQQNEINLWQDEPYNFPPEEKQEINEETNDYDHLFYKSKEWEEDYDPWSWDEDLGEEYEEDNEDF